jgi:hypothetical protein|tara:strand:- start:245 stop:475 length:231 start_codon:yes stop_codon:yes gene_type:complete
MKSEKVFIDNVYDYGNAWIGSKYVKIRGEKSIQHVIDFTCCLCILRIDVDFHNASTITIGILGLFVRLGAGYFRYG